ncbi:MAG: alpha-glucan family phosphorylase [Armatimonadota bacterium]
MMNHVEPYSPDVYAFDTPRAPDVAYFSMEIAIRSEIPTYSGGLGVLAGDALRAAADLQLRMVGVTLLYRKGYLRQHIDPDGNQTESDEQWEPRDFLELLPVRTTVQIEGREVILQAWRLQLEGVTGGLTSVIFMDADVEGNSEYDRGLTDHLYARDQRYRLAQEIILGMGGLEMLRALNWHGNLVFHMNEGHSALLALRLLQRHLQAQGQQEVSDAAIDWVREQCIFTTHTPVPAGHDVYEADLVRQMLGEVEQGLLEDSGCCHDDRLNMTYLALRFSRYINGVALKHGEISAGMYPNYPIHSITNGVHGETWTSKPFAELFDKYMPIWRLDNRYLRYAEGIGLEEIQQAHAVAKRELLAEVQRRTGYGLDEKVLTLGFARRATAYKRADLLFSDLDRLRRLATEVGPVQVLYAGKAHPSDELGKEMIRRVIEAAKQLSGAVPVIYLEEYEMDLGALITAGVDLWLNTPLKPHEASGTSGMKCALNGVPSFSVLDGWWLEGHIEGVTGWAIGTEHPGDEDVEREALYEKLERVIVPMFYQRPRDWANLMRDCISLNGSFFNAQRMVAQYEISAYAPAHQVTERPYEREPVLMA